MLICDLTEFIPEATRGDEINKSVIELHKLLCRMRNLNLPRRNSLLYDLLSLLDSKINPDGLDYWNSFIEPWIGTSEIQRFILKLMKLNGELLEWYTQGQPVNTYTFQLDRAPSVDVIRKLIKLSLSLKNIESHLTAIHDKNCPKMLTLSETTNNLDYYLLSDITANSIDGVKICFTGSYKFDIHKSTGESLWEISIDKSHTSEHVYTVPFWKQLLLDEDIYLNDSPDTFIWSSYWRSLPNEFIQLPPAMNSYTLKWDHKYKWSKDISWINQSYLTVLNIFTNPIKKGYRNANLFLPDGYSDTSGKSTYDLVVAKRKSSKSYVRSARFFNSYTLSEYSTLNDDSQVLCRYKHTRE